MSCTTIYDELESYAQGRRGEPFVQGVCGRALTEMHQVLDSVRLEHEKYLALLAKNNELHEKVLVLMAENGNLHDDLTTLQVSAQASIRLLELSLPGAAMVSPNPVVIGNATLYLGDCLEILPTLDKVDAVITDPPYGVNFTKKKNDYHHSSNGKSSMASVLYDDHPARIRQLIQRVMPLLLEVARVVVITPGAKMLFAYPEPNSIGAIFFPAGLGLSSWGFQCSHPILYYGKCPYGKRGMGSRPNGFSATHTQPNREVIDHPCPKPVEWMNWLVNRASFKNETVLDPFMGSGTTGVACMNLDRKFIGIEIEPRYFDIACERIERAQAQQRLAL